MKTDRQLTNGISLLDQRAGVQQSVKQKAGTAPLFDAKAASMYDLMFQEFAPLCWIVDGLIPEGTILVAGKPKSGKSWLVLNVLLSAVLDARFLKERVVKCGALYLALEDNSRRMRSRMDVLMQHYGDHLDALKSFEYRCEWPAGMEGAAALGEYLTDHPETKIVAVDVLKNIRPRTADARRSGYELDYEAIEPWKQVAHEHRVTLLIVHHTRKAEADDVFDEVSGTLGINGVVDQMIVVKRVIGDSKLATAHFRGRDLEEDRELGIELRAGWWELVGSAQQISANDARRLVLDVMRDHEIPMTVAEIQKATGKKSRTSTDKLLKKMHEDGLVSRDGHRYSIPVSL